MNTETQLQTELEAMQASERVARENLQELARLVLAFNAECESGSLAACSDSFLSMIDFAKGVAQ